MSRDRCPNYFIGLGAGKTAEMPSERLCGDTEQPEARFSYPETILNPKLRPYPYE